MVEEDEDEEEETERSAEHSRVVSAAARGSGDETREVDDDERRLRPANHSARPRAESGVCARRARDDAGEDVEELASRLCRRERDGARPASSAPPPARGGRFRGARSRVRDGGVGRVGRLVALGRRRVDGSPGRRVSRGLRPLGPETEDSANGARRREGWRDAFTFFAAHHGASPTTVALAEAAAIARRWNVDVPSSVVSEVHVRCATAVSEIASGRASDEEAAHARVSAIILPIAEISLRSLLASPRGTDAETAATKVRALTPVLALSMPLDTPAPDVCKFLKSRRVARGAVDRIARDLSTPLPGEARAVAEVEAAAARFVASGRDDDTDFVSNLNASKAAFSRTRRDGRRVGGANLPRRRARFQVFHPRARRQGGGDRRGVFPPISPCFARYHREWPPRAWRFTPPPPRRRAAFDATGNRGIRVGASFLRDNRGARRRASNLHARMLENGLGSSTGALTAVALDDLIRPSLEEMLAAVRSASGARASHGGGAEKSSKLPPSPVAPARGAMHSASLVELFAALRDTFVAVMPATVCGRRRLRAHAEEVEKILGGRRIRWYGGTRTRVPGRGSRRARARLWENCGVVTRPAKSDGADEISAKGAPSAAAPARVSHAAEQHSRVRDVSSRASRGLPRDLAGVRRGRCRGGRHGL